MPKIVTAKRREEEMERARLYLKSRLMLPTIPLGMVALLAGYGGIVMMWVQDDLSPGAVYGSTVLLLFGALWGWGHARYERYLVTICPEYLARKLKLLDAAKEYKRVGKSVSVSGPVHQGRRFVWAAYAVGVCSQFAMTAYFVDQVGAYPAFFLPWAGYFNAKIIFWRNLFSS